MEKTKLIATVISDADMGKFLKEKIDFKLKYSDSIHYEFTSITMVPMPMGNGVGMIAVPSYYAEIYVTEEQYESFVFQQKIKVS